MKDYIIRAIDKDKSFRVFIATTTDMVDKASKIHNTSATASAALGRVLTATSIMGLMLKGDNDRLTLQFKGNGPIKSIVAVSNNKGEVKGYVGNPSADLPPKENSKLDVGNLVGKNGKLIVIKDLGLREPYIGQSDIVSGEIAEDLAHYYALSEQQPSAIALGTYVDKNLNVKASGGIIIQVLPNISDENLSLLEHKINSLTPISELIRKGFTPEEILNGVFEEFDMEILEKVFVNYKCDCSIDRMEKALISLGKEELKDIINNDESTELVCHFCNKKYTFSKQDLENLLYEISN